MTTTHVDPDHDTCLDVAMLRGGGQALHTYADAVLAERGFCHGHLFLIPIDAQAHTHPHGDDDTLYDHVHMKDRF